MNNSHHYLFLSWTLLHKTYYQWQGRFHDSEMGGGGGRGLCAPASPGGGGGRLCFPPTSTDFWNGPCMAYRSGGSKGGGVQQAHAPKLDQLCFLNQHFSIRMLNNKAQIARDSIKTVLELPGPLSGPWTPAESEFGSTRNVRVGT